MAQLNDLGIDLGTSNVLIYQQGKGLVLRRPAVVAIERSTKKVLAIGDDAQRMVGRTPSNIMAIRPLKQGTVADFELTNTMLRFFLNGVLSKRLFSGPRVVMSVPSGVTETEKHSLINILLDAGVKRTYLLDRPLAAALGVGMDLRASLILPLFPRAKSSSPPASIMPATTLMTRLSATSARSTLC